MLKPSTGRSKTIKLASLILGLIGGVIGFMTGGFLMLAALGSESGGGAIWAIGLMFISVFGIVGAALALKNPAASGILQLISAVLGLFVGFFVAYFMAFPFLLIGGILALADPRKEH
ncbi:MAG: hypothetical protein KM312_07795 [Hydrogenibacillus schlegelii]|uniref:DUF4064 domain-containing protein n=2 Tax=Hydrogenibacillus schlegelii TaxID=1484 RepID=A0A947D1Y0_HYDSH|nr:hypothetical protein [Hydrogenibacillus schlegelii]